MKSKYKPGNLIPGTVMLAAIGAGLNAAPGVTFLANSADMASASTVSDLTDYTVSCPSDDLEAMLNTLFPSVDAQGRLFRFRKEANEDFLMETRDDDIRDTGAAPKIVKFHGETATGEVRNKILGHVIDTDAWPRDQKGKRKQSELQKRVKALRRRLVRADLFRGLSLLNAAAANTAVTWNAASNPDGDLRAKIEAAACRPNIIVFSALAWSTRKDAYEAPGRANHAMASHANYTEAELAEYLGVSKVVVLRAKYMAIEGGALLDMLGNTVFGYYSSDMRTEDDASNIKRFTDKCDDGGDWQVYVEERVKTVTPFVEHYSQFIVTRSADIFKLTVTP